MANCFSYKAYSTTVHSDIPLALGEPVAGAGPAGIFLNGGESANQPATPYWIEILNSQDRVVHLRSRDPFDATGARNFWLISVENVANFWWQRGQRHISYLSFGTQGFGYWLLHLVIPLFMRLEEGVLMMHTAGVAIHNRGVLLSANSFGGKSTLAHALLGDGHKLLADDKLGLFVENNTLMCTSSYPYCRNYRATEDLGKPVTEHQPASLEVGGIYILTRGDPETAVSIEPLQGYEAFSLLQENRDIPLSFLRRQEFLRLGAVARLARVFRLEMPWALERSGEVARAIAEHQARINHTGHDGNGGQID